MISEFLEHYDFALSYAIKIAKGDSDLASDITQNVFMTPCKNTNNFGNENDTKRNHRAYLTFCIRNTYINEYRRRKKLPSMVDIKHGYGIVENVADKSKIALSQTMRFALSSLKGNERLCLLLYGVYDYSYEEIAGIMGIPMGTVRSILFRARANMKQVLQK